MERKFVNTPEKLTITGVGLKTAAEDGFDIRPASHLHPPNGPIWAYAVLSGPRGREESLPSWMARSFVSERMPANGFGFLTAFRSRYDGLSAVSAPSPS